MAKKTPGEFHPPPPAYEFNQLPLAPPCTLESGFLYRLHSTNVETGAPWPAVFFSRRGTSRFDPVEGVGTLYAAKSLAGAVLEVFDDRWGPVGSIERTLTPSELETWWVTLVDLPPTTVFDTSGVDLSKIGTDLQLLAGDHATARTWALRLMEHPANLGGIVYASRHAHTKVNLAIFQRKALLPEMFDANLGPKTISAWTREARHGANIIFGPAIKLGTHPELIAVSKELEVGLPGPA
jgi:RES domain-containing protein